MNCKQLHKQIIFYLEGSIDHSKKIEFKHHLQNCKQCSKYVAEITKTLDIISIEKEKDVSPYFYTKVKNGLENNFHKSEKLILQYALSAFFSILLLVAIYSGIKIGSLPSEKFTSYYKHNQEEILFLNDITTEPIESFLIN